MAQIIKQRRGSITQLKDVTARVSELVVATGSIGNLNGPFLFVGETEGIAGAYRPISKIYQGASAPTIAVGSYGSVMDGTPFYASGNKSLYILSQAGNSIMDFTGNIEGNTISNVTITSLTGSNANYANLTGTTFTSTNSNITSLTGSNGNITNLTGSTFTSTNANITSLTGSNAFVTNVTGGTLTVTGTTNLNGDLLISGNIIQTGSIDLTGNVRIGGNITVGDATSDFVSFGAEISSSIVPDIHNAFDLGSSEKNWRNLHISGTAYINTLEANQVNFTDLGVLEDLTVSGSTFLGNGGDITVISGSVYNDQLTEKRMVVVGSQGLLTDYSGLTFDNGNLNLSGALEVTNIQGTGSLYLKPDLDDSRLFEIYNSAGPSGYTDIHFVGNADLNFFGDDTNYLKIDDYAQTATLVGVNGVFVSSSLNVTGSSTLNSTLEVKGATGLNSTLDVTGSAILKSTLQVDSTSELKGAVGMNSTLDVTGSAQFKSTINVDGIATVSSSVVEDLTQYRVVGVGSGGALIDYSGLTYNGTVLQIGGGQFEVDNADGDIRTSGSLTANGFTSNGDLTVNGVLTVTGNTQLQSNLYVSGNLEVLGSATNVIIQSQTIELDDNIIRLNAYSPFERYAGFEVIDSGSSNTSASLLWDSANDYWLFMSSSGQSSKLIGTTTGTYGSEVSLTDTYFPIATGPNTIGDSLLRYSGTSLSFNTNKFTVDSGTGDTLVSGNFTLSYSGGTDTNSNTSAIMFRNSSNVVGFVSTTETEDVLDGILGYKNSNGGLVFSTVIDGGTY
jgi:cytoskeletal protein CcmA (bactofilin family)